MGNIQTQEKRKLYILKPVPDDPMWEPWYDKAFGFIVCAKSPIEARKLAAEKAGDEVQNIFNEDYSKLLKTINPWLDAAHSTCSELKPTTKNKVIMRDFNAA